ncbi:hypothetical protein QQP08_017881 [Theobroma cacao]|nr:hypothetical protein QQP08_017881 [Theobroma cacao]
MLILTFHRTQALFQSQSLIGTVKQSSFYKPETRTHTKCNGLINHMKSITRIIFLPDAMLCRL